MSPISEPGDTPQVSVLMLTHNHASYIAQAIASVRSQTLFPDCELLIGEDASSDATASLCEQAQHEDPEHIQVFSSPGGALGFHRNFARLLERARGRYVAFLEGDDWWCDPQKLALQVALLDRSPHLAFCGTHTRVVDQRSIRTGSSCSQTVDGRIGPPSGIEELDFQALIIGYTFHFSSVLMRREVVQLPSWIYEQYCLDRPLYLLAATMGAAGVIDAETSVYRLHDGGIWAPLSPLEKASRSRSLFGVFCRHFPRIYHHQFHLALHGILMGYLGESLGTQRRRQTARLLAMSIGACPRQALLRKHRFTFGIAKKLVMSHLKTLPALSSGRAQV